MIGQGLRIIANKSDTFESMNRYTLSFLAFFYLSQEAPAQRVIAEFPSKNKQLNFQAIPFGVSILFSYDEVVGPNGRRVRDVK